MRGTRDFENTFIRAWELLVANWIIVLPGIVLGVASGFCSLVLGTIVSGDLAMPGSGSDVSYVSHIVYAVAMVVIGVLASLVQMAFVTGMAGAAWQRGNASLADGWNALTHRIVQLFLATALLFLIGDCAAVLAPVTFLVTLLVYATFLIYTMASVIVGKREALAAIVESCRLALSNIVPTLGIVVLIAVIAFAGGSIGSLIARVTPFGGSLVAGVLQQAIVAYASLVVMGEYLKLQAA